jgi:hypothetical protein
VSAGCAKPKQPKSGRTEADKHVQTPPASVISEKAKDKNPQQSSGVAQTTRSGRKICQSSKYFD